MLMKRLEPFYVCILGADAAIAGTFTGGHWLDQVMQLPSCKSRVLIFTQSGMVCAVAVDQLPSDESSSFGDLAISKVSTPFSCCACYVVF